MSVDHETKKEKLFQGEGTLEHPYKPIDSFNNYQTVDEVVTESWQKAFSGEKVFFDFGILGKFSISRQIGSTEPLFAAEEKHANINFRLFRLASYATSKYTQTTIIGLIKGED